MSRVREVRHQLEEACRALESLEVQRAAGRLSAEEYERQRAERERDAGRLYVSLRNAQREVRARHAEPPAPEPAPERSSRLRSPLVILPAAVLLVAVGVGAGVGLGRLFKAAPGGAVPSGPPPSGPAGGMAAVAPEIELQALRQIADREDAPVSGLLQFAHVALDQGKLDEARRAYERVLAREPRNVEAIDHIGAVLFQEGRIDEALAKVEEALRIDPRYVHALWDRTQYLFHAKQDFAAAIKAGEAFLDVLPEGPDADNVRKLMAEARQRASEGATRPR